ncbi:hypothetical protein LK994_01140 [Ferruginibacter lapsinanis]|uniref:hypothetical protein n=1 Tax=Ferruginibacter lapsinanis TaxID=563172 RepID=UPI001E6569E3|nr:hypothetical protein [Ferruginibacter lapsinanis]UEG50079.1 hypothetical protein LK994_01140 [Ferruginibacter lapsinanis]
MKYLATYILIFIFLSCQSGQNSIEATKPNLGQVPDKMDKTKNITIDTNAFNGQWQQYKKEGAKPNDTIPNLTCFVKITADTFYYITNKKVQYIDLLVKDNSYKYPVYGFKNHYQDKLYVLTEDYKELQLRKYANEGDYEYFKKSVTKK